MDIETMPHATYFTSNTDTVTKINHVPYQTIVYNDNGMFSHYIPIINSPSYIHTQRQKVTLLYIQEED